MWGSAPPPVVIFPILILSIRDEFGEMMHFQHQDLGGKKNIAALVESWDHKKEKFDPRKGTHTLGGERKEKGM